MKATKKEFLGGKAKTRLLTVLIKQMPFVKNIWKLIRLLSTAVVAYLQFTHEIASALSYKWSIPDDRVFYGQQSRKGRTTWRSSS